MASPIKASFGYVHLSKLSLYKAKLSALLSQAYKTSL